MNEVEVPHSFQIEPPPSYDEIMIKPQDSNFKAINIDYANKTNQKDASPPPYRVNVMTIEI